MPNHNDYHAFKSTTPKGGGSGGGYGCLPKIIFWGIAILVYILIAKE